MCGLFRQVFVAPVAIDVCDEAMWMVADASADSEPEQRRLFVSADGRTVIPHQ